MTLWKWSQTAASNATADSTINYAEGMAPSALNDSARAAMAALAKYRDDVSGNLVTGGTSTAYTLTTNQSLTTLTDGFKLAARMNATNGATPTLNVDSLGAKQIRSVYGTNIAAGALLNNGVYTFVYDSTDGAWIVHGGLGGFVQAANNLSDVASAATARTNLGVGTGDSPQFTAINLGHASDTTLARSGAGDMTSARR